MRAIHADFKPPSVPTWRLWAACACVFVGAIASSVAAWTERQNTATLAATYLALPAPGLTQGGVPSPPTHAKLYERSARQMLSERHLPWPEALTALEAIRMDGITLRSIEGSAGNGSIRVEILASDHAKVLDFVEALNAGSDSMSDVQWNLQQAQVDGLNGSAVAIIGAKRPDRLAPPSPR